MNFLATILPLVDTLTGTLAEKVPAPEDVKAGWVAFGIFLALGAAVVFLAFSLRKHLKKVTFDEDATTKDKPDVSP